MITRIKCKGKAKTLLDRCHLVFRNYTAKTKSKRKQNKQKTSVYILNQCEEIGQSIEESQRGGKLKISQELFRMNNKTLIKLAFPVMKGVKNCANL